MANAFCVHLAFQYNTSMDSSFSNIQCSPNPISSTQLHQIATQQLYHMEMGETRQSSRFENPLSTQQFNQTLASRIPGNTVKNTNWAVSIFKEWRQWRNFLQGSKMDPNWPIPSLEEGSYVQLDDWLARFIMEIRKEDQSHYTGSKFRYEV